MSRYVSSDSDEGRRLRAAVHAGTVERVGGVPPCREMKGMGWSVVRWEGRIYASVIDGNGDDVGCFEAIEPAELRLYDDTNPPAPSARESAPGKEADHE